MNSTHRISLFLPAALVVALGADPGAARADTQWTFGGFGTLSAVHSTETQADYTASQIARGSAGYSRDWAFDVDSRLGAQLGAQFDKHWSAVAQVIEERAADAAYRPRVEWAYVKYQVTPELSVRAGRIALPLFLAADYRKASYALPWVRTPVELYILMPISNSDGVDASLRWNGWGTKQETQAIVGRSAMRLGGKRARQIGERAGPDAHGDRRRADLARHGGASAPEGGRGAAVFRHVSGIRPGGPGAGRAL